MGIEIFSLNVAIKKGEMRMMRKVLILYLREKVEEFLCEK